MNRDPVYFPDYDDFRPERYLDDSGAVCDNVPDTRSQGHLTFGAGRRCVESVLSTQLAADVFLASKGLRREGHHQSGSIHQYRCYVMGVQHRGSYWR